MGNPPGVPSDDGCPPRRALLAAMAAAGSLVAMSACSSDGSPGAADAGVAVTETPSGVAPDGAHTSAPSGADSGPRQELTSASSVPVGGGTVVAGVLVVQPIAGRFKAYEAVCPHQGIRLGPPRQGVITCSAHMSIFRERDGALLRGPATRGLTKVPVIVEGDVVYRT